MSFMSVATFGTPESVFFVEAFSQPTTKSNAKVTTNKYFIIFSYFDLAHAVAEILVSRPASTHAVVPPVTLYSFRKPAFSRMLVPRLER